MQVVIFAQLHDLTHGFSSSRLLRAVHRRVKQAERWCVLSKPLSEGAISLEVAFNAAVLENVALCVLHYSC